MKKSFYVNILVLSLVFAVLSGSAASLAAEKDKEKMMWRGFILMEGSEKREYDIGPSKELGWRHGIKSHYKSQVATIQVISADPLGSGDTKLSGMVHVHMQDHEIFEVRPPSSWCTHGWVKNEDTQKADGSEMIRDNQLRISFAKKSHVDAAPAIEQAIKNCGTDPDCLANVYNQFKGVVEDQSQSFPIKMVVQCFPSCPGVIQTRSVRTSGQNCKNEEKTERDTSYNITTDLCSPMHFEMDGMYTHGKEGDKITAFFQDSGENPDKAFDEQDYPVQWKVRCTVNLTNGPPEVRIYRLTDDAPPKDITDKEEKVLVGEMIKLQACVVGTGLGEETERKWEIPDENIKNWEADRDKGPNREDVNDDDLKKGIIRFACVDGETGGKNKTVTFRAVFANAELKGETHLKVYEPKVEELEFDYGDLVGVGGACAELTPAKGGDSLGIKWKAKVTMPSDFQDRQHCIQFVQIFSGNNWFLFKTGQPGLYEWFEQSSSGVLDTSYPYCGPACGAETVLEMRDNPGAPLSTYASGYVDENFLAYLMFRPGSELDMHSVWVPLKRVDWGWKGVIIAKGDPYARNRTTLPCKDRWELIGNCVRSPASFNPHVQDTILYPEWKGCYVEEQDKPKTTRIQVQDHTLPPPWQAGWVCP